jgi:hypothetical protein
MRLCLSREEVTDPDPDRARCPLSVTERAEEAGGDFSHGKPSSVFFIPRLGRVGGGRALRSLPCHSQLSGRQRQLL